MLSTPADVDARGVLALSDGRAGNARQAGALAAALAASSSEHVLAPRAPWRWAAPRRSPMDSRAFGPCFESLLAAPPALAVGCGRQAALATRILRQRGARVVQVLDPRLPVRHWDLVVAPAHDSLQGANVITLAGSLHPVDDAWLQAGRDAFPEFGALPSPRVAVLVGGPTGRTGFNVADFDALVRASAGLALRTGGSLMLVASRRTPEAVRSAMRRWRPVVPTRTWVDAADGPNPYAGFLAWADAVACTADSVNMLSEACATPAPVFVHRPEAMAGRPRRFVDDLLSRGRVRTLDADAGWFAAEPLRETARVAAEVCARLGWAGSMA